MNNFAIRQPMTPHTIRVMGRDQTEEVMRITRDGVWVNPNVSVDDAAKAVLAALDAHIKALVEAAVQAERERFAMECIDLVAFHGGPVDLEAAIRAKGGAW